MVGDGQDIRVWIDPWIEDNGTRCPWMKHPLINLDLMVSDLIIVETRSWDRSKLEDQFFQGDVERILSIKPAVHLADFWSWKFNRNGDFSVRSAYWLACQFNKTEVQLEAEVQPSFNGIKEKVWFLQTAPKIKTFLWRVLSNALPVADNILARGMKIEAECQICGFDGESSNHVLFTCSLARQIWAMTDFPFPENGFHVESVQVNIHYLMMMSKNIRVPLVIRRCFPWVLWFLWKNRNKFIYEGVIFRANVTIDKILKEVKSWFLSQHVNREVDGREEIRRKGEKDHWKLPSLPWLKCNTIVVWDKRSNVAWCSWVLRNHVGTVLLHSRRSFSTIGSLFEAKMVSMLWSLESLTLHRVDKVIISAEEADILGIMRRPHEWISFKAHFWELNRSLVKLANWKVEVVSRAANRGAFLIAQSALKDRF
ncbi:unnamed protein product [Microthlaspi erraticum]|uniref:Reverse transcriptase zinc-binding domain-containing protein n=1 Tax=Microthlaspi erraticum TaxID=1685480 RepID=A0A6D2KTH6_9BRAS|nr:unnamed protein product [Microthlaspi erraticum]